MKIYYLKWSPTGAVSDGGAAYTTRKRAEEHAEYCNGRLSRRRRILCCKWIIGTLDLKEGPNHENR